ncbi:MAG: hypothetical protein L3J71_02675 [Victivallaceae bacterium]|nr:hypothetical protein [Victivallaceae bacterium]
MRKLLFSILLLNLHVYCLTPIFAQNATDTASQKLLNSAQTSRFKLPTATKAIAVATDHLLKEFDRWLEHPKRYKIIALKECKGFPEGKLYPFTIPALAYTNLALSGKIKQEHAARQIRKLLDAVIPIVAEFIHAPGGDIMQMKSYSRHGTFLSTLNLALANYALVSKDGRYKKLHNHIPQLLLNALKSKKGAYIDSYPTYTWYFDTIMALLSLSLWEHETKQSVTSALLNAHLAWRNKNIVFKTTGLPRAFPESNSRGCDISMQICLFANLRPAEAQKLYDNYVKAHWIELPYAAGFSEWPKGAKTPSGGDIDSGPIFFGIGSTASGVGIGAAIAVNDQVRLKRLAQQLYIVSPLIHTIIASGKNSPLLAWFGRNIPLNKEYLTGFLYGDAVLFYAVTWTKYPNEKTK